MSRPAKHVDITAYPDLLRLVEEVQASNEPRMLTRDHTPVAILMPAGASRRRVKRRPKGKTEAHYEAFKATAGSLQGFVDEKLMEEIYEGRSVSSSPPFER